jgi:hypothetical protein
MNIFKTITLTLGLFFIINTASARKFFVSSTSGNDNNTFTQAQSQTTPWASINKVNSQMASFAAGDTICFKRGESFFGQLVVNKGGTAAAPIVFTDYGTGNLPIITGELALSNWTSAGTNIYKTTAASLVRRPSLLWWNNQIMQIARYPNFNSTDGGYLTIDTCSGKTWLKSSGIPAATNWVGAEAVIRNKQWLIDRPEVISQNGNELTISSANTETVYGVFRYYDIPRYWGMFLQNAVGALDQQGEYCFNNTTKELFVYSTAQPASGVIKVSVIDTLVRVQTNISNISFKNISFQFANKMGIVAIDCPNLKIENCKMQYVGRCFASLRSNGLVLKQNIFTDSENNGFEYIYGDNVVITENEFRRMGLRRGAGLSGDGTYVGLSLTGTGYTVTNNIVDSVGYNAVETSGCNNLLLKNNEISNALLVKTDGGGVYSYYDNPTVGRVYEANIVRDIIGDDFGTNNRSLNSYGMYADENSNRISFLNNTISNVKTGAIFTHISNKHIIRNNSFVNCGKGIYQIFEAKDTALSALSTIKNNIFHNDNPNRESYGFGSGIPIFNSAVFSLHDSNYFQKPFDKLKLNIRGWYYTPDGSYTTNSWTLARWKAQNNTQINTLVGAQLAPYYAVLSTVGNNRINDSAFNNTNIWSTWYVPGGYSNVVLDRNEGGVLDGGCLQTNLNTITNDEANSIVVGTYAIGDLQKGKNYIFKFSGKASAQSNGMSMYTFNPSPYTSTAEGQQWDMDTTRREYEFLVQPTVSKTTNQLEIDCRETAATLYLDNMSLREANIAYTNPNDYVFFKYNATTSAITQTLPAGFWKDVKEIVYSGTITIQPFASVILYKTNTPICNTPTSLSSNSITTNSATVSWAAVSGAVNYTVEYKLASASTWTVLANTASTTQNITGLSASSLYDWRVKTNCTSNQSTYTTAQFTTATPPCSAPTGLSSSNITTNSATLNWAAVSGAINYTVEYKLASASTWIVMLNTSNTSQNITGLSASSLYNWRVKTNCANNQSTYTTAQFTTVAPAPTCNKNVLFVNVYGVAYAGTADKAMVDRMTAMGYTVTVKQDYYVTTADTAGKGLIFISPTVVPSYVGTKFRNVSKPVVVCDNAMFVNMSMVGNGASNSSYVYLNNINITNATHPIASGVTTGVISSNNNYAYWGNPSTSAAKIANVPGNTNRWMVYSYDAGNAMSGLNAPGRRVGYYLYDNAALYFNANAWKLFDNIINWTTCNNLTGARVANYTIAAEPSTKEASLEISKVLSLFPDPVTDVLTITGLQANSVIQVMDIKGSLIQTITTTQATQRLTVSSFTAGTYLLRITHNNRSQLLRFIKH